MELTYNGVTLDNVRLNSYIREPVYDDVSGEEVIWERHLIDVTAIVSGTKTNWKYDQPSGALVRNLGGENATINDGAIRARLMRPRMSLTMTNGGQVVIQSPAFGLDRDVNNGPLPRRCDIQRVHGADAFVVHFVVETFLAECPPENPVPQYLISNRFTSSHSVDAQYRTVLSYEGVSVFRADILARDGLVADHFRNTCLPPPTLGFRREQIRVTAYRGKIHILHWSFQEVEQFEYVGDPNILGDNPWGIVDFRAPVTYSTIEDENGVPATGACLISLQCDAFGTNISSTWRITQFCIAMAISKLKIGVPVGKSRVLLRHMSITQDAKERRVSLSAIAMAPADPGGGVSKVVEQWLQTDEYEILPARRAGRVYNPPLDGATRGTYGYELIVAAFAQACRPAPTPGVLAGIPPKEGDQPPSDLEPPEEDTIIEIIPGAPRPNKRISRDNTDAYYDSYKIWMRYLTDQGVMIAPLARPADRGLPALPRASDPADYPVAPTSSFIRTRLPTQKLVVRWEASRANVPPRAPTPYSTDDNLVLLNADPTTSSVQLLSDGSTLAYKIEGVYEYGVKVPVMPDRDGLRFGVPPWIRFDVDKASFPAAAFTNGIIDAPIAPAYDPQLASPALAATDDPDDSGDGDPLIAELDDAATYPSSRDDWLNA